MFPPQVMRQEKGGQSFLPLPCVIFGPSVSLDNAHLTLGKVIYFTESPVQMQISFRNTITDPTRNNLESGHPMASQVDRENEPSQ